MKTISGPSLPLLARRSAAVLVVTILLLAASAVGQTPGELGTGSYTGAGNGPSAAQQSGRILLNTSGTTYVAPNTNVTVTATIGNQQYTGVNTGTGNPVLMFGATVNASGTTPVVRPVYANMNDVGTPANTMYSNLTSGAAGGIDVTTNQAFNFFTSIYQWAGTRTPTPTNRTYIADLTLNFSTPLTNPMLHLVGLGGTSGTLGFATEFDLATAGLTLTKMQGNSTLVVTSTTINNGASNMGSACDTNFAGCGTIRLNGSNIQSVKFKVYVEADTGGRTDWSGTTVHAGDQWLLSVSIPETFSVSGTVFNDPNAMVDNMVNGTGTAFAGITQLYANLIEPVSGKVIGSVPVGAGGTYSFSGVPSGANVRVEISTNQGTQLAAGPAISLPVGWRNTGEIVGTGTGSEASPNGALAFTVSANVTNVNFGISNAPTAGEASVSGRVLTADGAGIRNVIVTLSDANGKVVATPTSDFGYFRFPEVDSGKVYILTVKAKRFQFANPNVILNVLGDIDDIEFIGY